MDDGETAPATPEVTRGDDATRAAVDAGGVDEERPGRVVYQPLRGPGHVPIVPRSGVPAPKSLSRELMLTASMLAIMLWRGPRPGRLPAPDEPPRRVRTRSRSRLCARASGGGVSGRAGEPGQRPADGDGHALAARDAVRPGHRVRRAGTAADPPSGRSMVAGAGGAGGRRGPRERRGVGHGAAIDPGCRRRSGDGRLLDPRRRGRDGSGRGRLHARLPGHGRHGRGRGADRCHRRPRADPRRADGALPAWSRRALAWAGARARCARGAAVREPARPPRRPAFPPQPHRPRPRDGGRIVPNAYEDFHGICQASYQRFVTKRPRLYAGMEASAARRLFGIDHQLLAGAGYRRSNVSTTVTWPGNQVLGFERDAVFFRTFGLTGFALPTRGQSARTTQDHAEAYVQDALRRGRWSLIAGLRFDDQRGRSLASAVEANPVFPDLLPAVHYPGSVARILWRDLLPRA